MDEYNVIVWDKQANNPYYITKYSELETAQQVARNMQRHYIDDWGGHAQSRYEIKLKKIRREDG